MNKFIISITTALVLVFGISVSNAQAACVVTGFSAAQSTVAYGGSTTVSWSTSGCDTVSVTPAQYPGNRPPVGSTGTGPLIQTTTFTIVGHTNSGSVSSARNVTITVTGNNGGGGSTTGQCKPLAFTAQSSTVNYGAGTVLHWDTQNCATVAIHPADYPGDRPATGSISTGAIFRSIEYTLTAYDARGNIGGQRFLTITVRGSGNTSNDNECEIDSFDADDRSLEEGDSTDLEWRTSGCDYVDISSSDRDYDDRNPDGTVQVSPDRTTTYTLRAYDSNGDLGDTDTVRISVEDEDNGNSCSIDNFFADRAFITRGQSARLSWAVSGDVDDIDVNPGYANRGTSDGSISITPTFTTTYALSVRCDDGSVRTASTAVAVQTPTVVTPPPVIVQQPPRTVISNVVTAKSAASLLELRVESNYDRMCVNGLIDYTITYRNLSSQTLEKSVLQFINPAEITYLTASRGNYDVVNRTMTIALGNIAPGEQGIITVHARVNDTAIRGNLTVATASVVYTNTKTRAQEDATAYSLLTVSDDCPNLLGASTFGFGSFLPNTLLGWLLLILVILALIVLARQFQRKPSA